MRVAGLPRSFYQLAKTTSGGLPPEAQERLRWVNCWQVLRRQGLTNSAAAETLELPRSTLYRWDRVLREEGLAGLRTRSRRPRRLRGPTWSPELAQAVLELREQFPRWGKDKLVVLLRRQGRQVSTSMVGRILIRLKASGVLKEPPRYGVSVRKRAHSRPYAMRKPKEYRAKQPGDIVQVDTLDIRPIPGVVLKHFTARDVVSRWDVIEVHTRSTSTLAAQFLHAMRRRFPFPIKAVQVDGGSEFQAAFESACRDWASDSSYCLPDLPSSTATSRGPSVPIQRSSTRCMTETWRWSPSTRCSWNGSVSTTHSGLTTHWTAALRQSILNSATQGWSRPNCLICTERVHFVDNSQDGLIHFRGVPMAESQSTSLIFPYNPT